ncbi:MAG TPA: M48 family metalloprotease [Terriglobales bacterium]|nr:M48 family metalloprotease [Terriglobales bacterium]
MRICKWMMTVVLPLALGAFAQQAAPVSSSAAGPQLAPQAAAPASTTSSGGDTTASSAPKAEARLTTEDQVIDRIIAREHGLMEMLKSRTPVVETYLQNLQWDAQLGPVPKDDRYFLGRMDLSDSIDRKTFLSDENLEKHLLGGFTKFFKVQYQPLGFSWMIFADRNDFDRKHYEFHYVRREFLGDVRTLIFDVTPKKGSGNGRFVGRIWVEDRDFNIVRLNGTYAPRPRNAYFFHMDSWRLNLIPGYWVPAYIYSEEGDFSFGAKNKIAFKAQTRIWGYDLKKEKKEDELTQVLVDSVKDESSAAQDSTPVESARAFEQEAEDNVVDRLESAGLLAPTGDLDKVLQTVVNNLLITNNIDLPRPVRTRVMLTTPLETFSVGNTIIISRGLVDVLPDESSLAAVLAHELGHIVLGQNLGSKYAFNDRMLFSDESTYNNLGFRHSPEEEASADKKAEHLLKNSPYSQKLDSAGLFLRALAYRAPELTGLLTPHLGNGFTENGAVIRLTDLMNAAPKLQMERLDQIAALPLGGRVKLNPWDDRVELVKSQPVALLSPREKMPFEVTPFLPHLSRLAAPGSEATTTANNTTK